MLSVELFIEHRRDGNADAQTMREWRQGIAALREFMAEHGFVGSFLVRPMAKVRWRTHDAGAVKVSTFDSSRRFISLVMRAPEVRGNAAWECRLLAEGDTNIEAVFDKFQDILTRRRNKIPVTPPVNGKTPIVQPPSPLDLLLAQAKPTGRTSSEDTNHVNTPKARAADVVPEPPAPPAVPKPAEDDIPSAGKLLQQLQSLEATANRERDRRKKLLEFNAQREALKAQIKALEAQLSGLDDQELALLDESANDADAKRAIETLRAFNALATS